jgi:hypothetical protein
MQGVEVGMMLEQIEKLFPGFLTKVREFPAIARAVLVVLILGGPAGLTWVYSHVSRNAWLRREVRIPLDAVILAVITVISIVAACFLIQHHIRVRRRLQKFLRDWLTFRRQFQGLCVSIDSYLIWDQKRNASIEEGRKELRDLLPAVTEYWDLRGRLREDVFRVGESRLCVNRSVQWEALKRRSALVSDYATPFSFLLDRGQPIAAWNLHHDEIWEALHIADEFVEYLRFRHPGLKQIGVANDAALVSH